MVILLTFLHEFPYQFEIILYYPHEIKRRNKKTTQYFRKLKYKGYPEPKKESISGLQNKFRSFLS